MAETKSAGRVTAFCDGGSRGNPGPAGYGVYIQSETGAPLAELSEFLGRRTNNYAEYQGLLAALQWAVDNRVESLRVVSDSELMVKQIKGQYSVKSPDLKPLYEEAKRRIHRLDTFHMEHVLRGKNKEADRLANEAMDRGMGRGPDVNPDRGMGRGPDVNPDRGMGRGPDVNPDRGMGRGPDGNADRGMGRGPDSNADRVAQSSAARGAGPATGQPSSAVPQRPAPTPTRSAPATPAGLPAEVTGFVKNGVVHLVEGNLPEGTFVRILPTRR